MFASDRSNGVTLTLLQAAMPVISMATGITFCSEGEGNGVAVGNDVARGGCVVVKGVGLGFGNGVFI